MFCCFPHLCPVATNGVLLLLDQYGLQSLLRRSFLLDPDLPCCFF
jgi:hypothetical protein